MILVFFLIALFYSGTLLALMRGLWRVRQSAPDSEQPLVSVIIAARNEEHNIVRLLDALGNQSYPRYEIVLVNDASSDRTSEIANGYIKKLPLLRVIDIGITGAHVISRKKNALKTGIEASTGEILLFTDADCLPGHRWIERTIKEFSHDTGIVAGFSPYVLSMSGSRGFATRLLQAFIQYEEIKGALWSAGAIGLKMPWLCTGRNLAYRRRVWDEVGGFHSIEHSIGGDDDLFLQLVARETQWRVRYCFDPETFVPTMFPQTFADFVSQRKRHFSAGKYFTLPMKAFFFCFHLSNLILVAGLFLGFLWPHLFAEASWFFLVKVAFDLAFALHGSRLFGARTIALSFLLMEFLYVCYTTLIGPLGFVSSFRWKPDPAR